MSPVLVVFGVQGTLQVNNNMGIFAGLMDALQHLFVFCLYRPPMDFYLETVNKHCNFLPQILFPLPLADYKRNKMKENYNLPPNHIGYKTDIKSASGLK